MNPRTEKDTNFFYSRTFNDFTPTKVTRNLQTAK